MPSCLVIDENNIVQKVANRILSGLDIETVAVSGLREAEAILGMKKTRFDLVLLSATMPDTPVDVALRTLRAGPVGTAPILVSLVEANLGLMTRSKRAGASGFLFRPFDRASLSAWVEPFLVAA
ncbi:response regulator [Aureimonas sp. AU40]|uniref:response regulator n=1 Tax=Aureimonas sp. AU40 TaxID=1637747 RepID=UPI00078473CB|nr:response regulator [Aureimonas sp. AU40]